MYEEDELLPLSALQHLVYCERRAALIHLEGLWAESVATVQGERIHERAHGGGGESRGDVRIARGLAVRSYRLGLSGKLDVLEFHRVADDVPGATGAVSLAGVGGRWIPFPVEYKRGRLREEDAYRVQLCGQALCLEEMMGVFVTSGAVYFAASNRRLDVQFDASLRATTEVAATALHALMQSQTTPPARYGPKCRECSLLQECLPRVSANRSARAYVANLFDGPEGNGCAGSSTRSM